MPRSGGITRRSGDPLPEKNLHSHTHDALAHALSGIDRQATSDRRRQASQYQEPPQRIVAEGSGLG